MRRDRIWLAKNAGNGFFLRSSLVIGQGGWQIGARFLPGVQVFQEAVELPLAVVFLADQKRRVTQLGGLLVFPLPLLGIVFLLLQVLGRRPGPPHTPPPYRHKHPRETDHQKNGAETREEPRAPSPLRGSRGGLFGNAGGLCFKGFSW